MRDTRVQVNGMAIALNKRNPWSTCSAINPEDWMKKLNACLISAGIALATSAAMANPPPMQTPPPPAQQQVEVSDRKLDKFAEIYVDVETTRSRLAAELASVEDPQKAQEIQMQMRDEIISTIENHGWSLEEYNEIAQVISTDDALREKTLERINSLTT